MSRAPLYSHMRKSYLATGLAIAIDALVLGAATAIVCLAGWLGTGANGAYLTIVSNVLFYEGGLLLVFGAMIGLFRLRGTSNIARLLMSPLRLLGIARVQEEDTTGENTGWLLIFLGAAVIALSLVVLAGYLI